MSYVSREIHTRHVAALFVLPVLSIVFVTLPTWKTWNDGSLVVQYTSWIFSAYANFQLLIISFPFPVFVNLNHTVAACLVWYDGRCYRASLRSRCPAASPSRDIVASRVSHFPLPERCGTTHIGGAKITAAPRLNVSNAQNGCKKREFLA